ncbi:MAG: hypothetical protein CSA95_04280 [Bacteroidetes bacterium]|nr:MAG: hypothetical protein CSA95_04280 [Bacteroidota bacterium]
MNWIKEKIVWITVIFAIVILSWLWGVVSVKFELMPYKYMKSIVKKRANAVAEFDRHFTDPILDSQDLLYKPVRTNDELTMRIKKMLFEIDDITRLYEHIILKSSSINDGLFRGIYTYNDKIDTVYAYYVKGENSTVGVNIIPGSGINQSSQILKKREISDNYQCNIDDVLIGYADLYIYIKPNEDILAIHNGNNKIGHISYVNYLINMGGSYSSYYLLQSIALSKFIKKEYDKLFVVGLSQGGAAALLNCFQSEPDKAIIASGYSIQMDAPYESGHSQIIIPNYRYIYNSTRVYSELNSLSTKFLFTYGLKETGLYGKEAQELITATSFDSLSNVECVTHPEGHIYYEPIIREFLKEDY